MGLSENQTKTRWNSKNYTQVKVSVDPDVAAAFKTACTASKISMAAVLSQYMEKYSKTTQKRKPENTTRRQRRKSVTSIIKQLENVKEAEERYLDAIPNNLHGSIVFETTDQIVSMLEDVIDLLGSVY